MPDLTLPAELVARMDAQPERNGPFAVSRNKFGAAILTEALDRREAALAKKRADMRKGAKLSK